MSADSLIANAAVFLGELIQRSTRPVVDGAPVPMTQVRVPLPFSRAEGADYLRIVELWKAYRSSRPIVAPARPCPACRADDSRMMFKSYDDYPYHECLRCGTWFVPLGITDEVIEEFFAAVPAAREIADRMVVARDEGTRENDRQRFRHYFQLLGAVTATPRVRYLDIGCGVGHSVTLASEYGWDATGVDSSGVAVAVARESGRNVHLPGDAAASGPYDVVSLFETLEHITDPDQVLGDAVKRMAPGAVVMITVPNRSSFEMSILRGRCFHIFGGSENVGHINLFDRRGLGTLLERHGLSLVFTDGQFSSDWSQLLAFLSDTGPSTAQWSGGDLDLTVPEAAYVLLNNLGPAFACLERALKRSPILLGIACRSGDLDAARRVASLEGAWRAEMQALLETQGEALLRHESEFRTLLATAQQEIARRDALLTETEYDAQLQISRRDTLLTEAQRDAQLQISRRDALLAETNATLQGQIDHRDRLLHQIQQTANDLQHQLAEAQRQINLRDDLLAAAQQRLEATVDERVRRRWRALQGRQS